MAIVADVGDAEPIKFGLSRDLQLTDWEIRHHLFPKYTL
jgi:hypothetical protein